MSGTPRLVKRVNGFFEWKEKYWRMKFSRTTRLIIIGGLLFTAGIVTGKVYSDLQVQKQFKTEK
jgi:hypothetical protein